MERRRQALAANLRSDPLSSREARPGGLSRGALVDAILAFVADRDLLPAGSIRTALEREIDEAGPDALVAPRARLARD